MKVVILCGGEGTRLMEYTYKVPKPLVKIGSKPILWHIMKFYACQGFNDFILCLGYKGDQIKEYFKNEKEFKIKFVDTGLKSNKAERIKQIEEYITEDEFFVAYGDDLSNVDIKKLLEYHKSQNKIVTLTAIRPYSQFGILQIHENNTITGFKEKPILDHWINGGFFVFNKQIFKYLKKGIELEKEVFEQLVKENQVLAFKHEGFWKCMNTFKDTLELNKIWEEDKAKWNLWEKKD